MSRGKEAARDASEDEWQAHVRLEAAKAIGTWLEARGRLHEPVRTLTMSDLEAMADNAIAWFVVLNSSRIRARPDRSESLMWLMGG